MSLGMILSACYPQDSEAQAAEEKPDRQSVYDRRAMRKYSEDETTRGVGFFVNMSTVLGMTGAEACDTLRHLFDQTEPKVEMDCRHHQSRGTLTEITRYIRGVPKKYNVNNIVESAPEIARDNRAAWLDVSG